jgi:hypothetical protein
LICLRIACFQLHHLFGGQSSNVTWAYVADTGLHETKCFPSRRVQMPILQ